MKTVTSKDGTTIAFDEVGEGTVLILVSGGMGARSQLNQQQLTDLLGRHFRVINYDRRGRGDSGDTLPYAMEREVEDIEALIDHTGGTAFVYGGSSGAILALEAANQFPTKVRKLALYEPSFIVDDSRPPLPDDYVEHVNELIAAGRRSEAVEYWMQTALRLPDEQIKELKTDPTWPELEGLAHTIAYDGIVMGDSMSGKPLPTDRWTSVTMPTLVMNGGETVMAFKHAARALTQLLPDTTYRELEGQEHGVEPDVLTPVLIEFFAG
jgi:pimeloyl-ACP methyl ester carboxylesterase